MSAQRSPLGFTAGFSYAAAMVASAMPGPVTVGNLIRSGQLLEIGCLDCGRVVHIKARTLRVAESQPVATLARRLKCSKCGAGNGPIYHPIWARPDAKVNPVAPS